MVGKQYWKHASLALTALMILGACETVGTEVEAEPSASDAQDPWAGLCIDDDGDGYGFNCNKATDCNDDDPTVHDACPACNTPETGCGCEEGTAPVSCYPDPEFTPTGSLLCKSGTRYCRDGRWSACESINTFELDAPKARNKELGSHQLAVVDPDAGDVVCSPCKPNCYRIDDPINPSDDSDGNSDGTDTTDSGGITIHSEIPPNPLPDADICIPGVGEDIDCDGIPDEFDESPLEPPFATDYGAIFMDLEPGESESETFEITFYMRTADVYFLVDMTGSMVDERDQLIADLTSGNFLPDPDVDCADRDYDGSVVDDNENKTGGIAGNIACLIRNARLGAGWFREIPFECGDDLSGYLCYGPTDIAVYEHMQDITTNIPDVLAALNRFDNVGNYDWPEAHMQALHSVATGEQLYTGWDRPGVPKREEMADCEPGTYGCCPEDSWGYPCFSDDAVPIVVLISDAAINAGPPTSDGSLGDFWVCNYSSCWNEGPHPIDYDPEAIDDANFGTTGEYTPIIGNPNENFVNRYEIGRVDNALLTFTGDLAEMTADLTDDDFGCGGTFSHDDGKDAVFRFHVDEQKELLVSAMGSRFDPIMAVIQDDGTIGVPATPVNLNLSDSGNTNGSLGNATDLGTLPSNANVTVTGDSSSLSSVFPRETMACFNSSTGSNGSDKAPDGAFKFQVNADMRLEFDLDGTDFDGVMSLYRGLPVVPEDCSFAGGCDSNPGSAGDVLANGLDIGEIDGRSVRVTDGNTSVASADYAEADFDAGGCSATGSSPDQVVNFTVGSTTTVRIETSGDSVQLRPNFDNQIAIVRRPDPAGTDTAVSGNDTTSNAEEIDEDELIGGAWLRFNGSTQALTADYAQDDVGGAAPGSCGLRAGGATDSKDAVFKLVLTEEKTLSFDTEGSDFNTYLSLHEGGVGEGGYVQEDVTSNNANSDAANPQALGTIDGKEINVDGGDTGAGGMIWAYSGAAFGSCRSNSSWAVTAVYTFVVDDEREINVNTRGSGMDTLLSIYRGNPLSGGTYVACNDDIGGGDRDSEIIRTLSSGTYYVLVRSYYSWGDGDYDLNIIDTAAEAGGGGAETCVDDGSFVDAYGYDCDDWDGYNCYNARETWGYSQSEEDDVLDGCPLTCGVCTPGGGGGGGGGGGAGAGGILLDCDSGSFPGNNMFSELDNVTLDAGTYYLVVKGDAAVQADYDYQLNVRVTDTGDLDMVECDQDGLATDRAGITRSLDPGYYSVVVRGQRAVDDGQYKLSIRDDSTSPTVVDCKNEAVAGDSSAFTVDLDAESGGNPIDYYLVMRGNDTADNGGGGDYTLTIRDGGNGTSLSAMTCRDDDTRLWPHYTATFDPGDYVVVLKGYDDDDEGWYQLTIGDPDLSQAGMSYDQATWMGDSGDGSDGVISALTEKGIRVISVLSDNGGSVDSYGQEQMETLANVTGATDVGGDPLVFNIDGDGSGMGSAIIEAVQLLSQNLEMDVGVRLVEAPDDPSPDFLFTVEAVDQVGDLCDAPIDTDNDALNLPDTHTNCGPGATPQFLVTFVNRELPNNVPINPDDPNGGYNMRLELIGDGQYVVDAIPVYIIPADVVPEEDAPVYEDSAQYWQDVASTGCTGNEIADWQSLYWSATIPTGTTLVWEACLTETQAELDSCSDSDYNTIATVTAGAVCTTDDECTNGFCQGNRCQHPVGPACMMDLDCGEGGTCAGGNCTWNENPIDPGPALVGLNGRSNIRMRVTMYANATNSAGPTIYDWRLDYTCSGGE